MKKDALERVQEVQRLIKSGFPVGKAIKTARTSTATYYAHLRNGRPAKKYARKSKLTIIDIPESKSGSQLFLVYGNPKMLAEFARGLS